MPVVNSILRGKGLLLAFRTRPYRRVLTRLIHRRLDPLVGKGPIHDGISPEGHFNLKVSFQSGICFHKKKEDHYFLNRNRPKIKRGVILLLQLDVTVIFVRGNEGVV